MSIKNDIKISICLVCYNQVNYIKEAIDSVLNNDLTNVLELIISDDGSTDGTLNILYEYKKKYPDLIKIIERKDENNYSGCAPDVIHYQIRQNYIRAINATADSDYIAILEGDDYWKSNKLEYIVNFIKNNPDISDKYSFLFHKYDVLKENKIYARPYPYKYNKIQEIDIKETTLDFQASNLSACIYNTKILKSILEKYRIISGVDYPLSILLTEIKPSLFIPEALSVYRESESGVWASLPEEIKKIKIIDRRMVLDLFFNKKYNNYFLPTIENYLADLSSYYNINLPTKIPKITKKYSKIINFDCLIEDNYLKIKLTLFGIKIQFRIKGD